MTYKPWTPEDEPRLRQEAIERAEAGELEEGWYWARYRDTDWTPAKLAYWFKSLTDEGKQAFIQFPGWAGSHAVADLNVEIGPRIQPPQEPKD